MTPEQLAAIKAISDERLAELDDWYRKFPSVSLTFCDQDYLEMRARLRELMAEVERLRERNTVCEYMVGNMQERVAALAADHEAAMREACEERCAKNRALAEVGRLQARVIKLEEVAKAAVRVLRRWERMRSIAEKNAGTVVIDGTVYAIPSTLELDRRPEAALSLREALTEAGFLALP